MNDKIAATIKIGIVGNPNCGKTTLFNLLTGKKQKVGNWPSVTVEKNIGSFSYDGKIIEVVDSPGIYSLSANSVDEKMTSEYVLSKNYDVVINIIDASSLERNLYLTSQLLEMKVPVIVVLNKMDLVAKNALNIDCFALQEKLSCWVVPMTAKNGQGLEKLQRGIITTARANLISPIAVVYPEFVEKAAQDIRSQLSQISNGSYDLYWLSIRLLEDDEMVRSLAGTKVQKLVNFWKEEIEEEMDEDADILIASARYQFIASILSGVVGKTGKDHLTFSDKIDKIVLHKYLGLPVLLLSMYLMFMFTIYLGGAFIDFFDILFGVVCVDWFSEVLTEQGLPLWSVVMLGKGLGGALQTMAIFVPPIGFLFFALSFLEETGYMARAAFVSDRAMRFAGLPGKAFIPMLIGYGCNVSAITASRTLENQRDRTLAVVMNSFMSCGARLPVYVLFIAVFFPESGQKLIFGLFLIGIAFAVFTGLVLKKTLLQGEISQFVMELPSYHVPALHTVFSLAFQRLKNFLFRAGKMLIPVIVVLSLLNSVGTDGTFDPDDSANSVLSVIGKTITPVFSPMGIKEENWPAAVGIFTGIFAKEALIGTLATLYTPSEYIDEEVRRVDVIAGINRAIATVPENLSDLANSLLKPFGIKVGNVDEASTTVRDFEVSNELYVSMQELFGEVSAAFAYLLFVLISFPCGAALVAVYRETNLLWAVFAFVWTNLLGYMAATLFYQGSTWVRHPIVSSLWIGGVLLLFMLVVAAMKAFAGGEKNA